MKPRHLAMGAALVLAAGLVIFGDNTPEDVVAEPVERAAAPAAAPAPDSRASQGKDKDKSVAILGLVPREALIGDNGDRFNQGQGDGGVQSWRAATAPTSCAKTRSSTAPTASTPSGRPC
ncbi:hypothetical protein [Massilia sp. IC2-476]|uniref:hypothetical protein n=1 Tax=Massilia sp. IC2-476 TaxID=2887199 RepID=UPI0027D97364|nr:hypothetical protein [Massilia sp. IC2-476]